MSEIFLLPIKVAVKGEMEFLKRNCFQPDKVTDIATFLYEMGLHVGAETVVVLQDDNDNGLNW